MARRRRNRRRLPTCATKLRLNLHTPANKSSATSANNSPDTKYNCAIETRPRGQTGCCPQRAVCVSNTDINVCVMGSHRRGSELVLQSLHAMHYASCLHETHGLPVLRCMRYSNCLRMHNYPLAWSKADPTQLVARTCGGKRLPKIEQATRA